MKYGESKQKLLWCKLPTKQKLHEGYETLAWSLVDKRGSFGPTMVGIETICIPSLLGKTGTKTTDKMFFFCVEKRIF